MAAETQDRNGEGLPRASRNAPGATRPDANEGPERGGRPFGRSGAASRGESLSVSIV